MLKRHGAVSKDWVGPGLHQLQSACWHRKLKNTSQSEYLPLANCQGLFSFLACASFIEEEAVWLEAAPGGADTEARVAEHSRCPQPALPLTGEKVRWCGLSMPRAL